MSDLLNSASLVMIPSGYKEDVVYSQIPTDGSGDLSFTRASNGTRINSAGLVEVVPWNLLANSQATWIGVSVTVTTGVTDPKGNTAGYTISAIGTGNETEYAYQAPSAFPVSTGTVITYSIYMKGSGTIATYIERAISGTYFFDTKVHTLSSEYQVFTHSYTATTDAGGVTVYVGNSAGTTASSVTIAFPQVNYGSTAKPYFPTTDRLNVPRLTYQNGGGGCPSLLLEKQSTNLLTYSEEFDNANWQKYQSTISANATTSPDGNTNADKIVENSLSGLHYVLQLAGSAGTYTLSVYAKADTRDWIYLTTYDGVADRGAFFNVSTGVVGNIDTGVTASIQSVGNGWYRCIVTATPVANFSSSVQLATANGTRSYTGNGTSGVYIWGAQLEASSYATSYIPTTSSSATRVADACFKTGISSLIGQTEGTLFVDVSGPSKTGDARYMTVSDGTASNRIVIYSTTLTSIGVYLQNSPSSSSALGFNTINGRMKIAFAYKNNDLRVYLNGILKDTITSFTSSFTLNSVTVGTYEDYQVYNSLDQSINEAIIFPTALTNAEAIALTTI